jgi:hypothetical protein
VGSSSRRSSGSIPTRVADWGNGRSTGSSGSVHLGGEIARDTAAASLGERCFELESLSGGCVTNDLNVLNVCVGAAAATEARLTPPTWPQTLCAPSMMRGSAAAGPAARCSCYLRAAAAARAAGRTGQHTRCAGRPRLTACAATAATHTCANGSGGGATEGQLQRRSGRGVRPPVRHTGRAQQRPRPHRNSRAHGRAESHVLKVLGSSRAAASDLFQETQDLRVQARTLRDTHARPTTGPASP